MSKKLTKEEFVKKAKKIHGDKYEYSKVKYKKFDWLDKQHLDFYLPKYNIAIECQGEQHFEVVKHFGGEDKYEIQQKRDFLKNKLCKENGIKLLYYTNYKKIEEDNITIFKNKENLINAII